MKKLSDKYCRRRRRPAKLSVSQGKEDKVKAAAPPA